MLATRRSSRTHRSAWAQALVLVLLPAVLRGQQPTGDWGLSFPCSGNVSNSRSGNLMMSTSRFQLSMPDIGGKAVQDARDTLGKLHLILRASPVGVPFATPDLVMMQAPKAGTRVFPGDTVLFCWVQRTIPNVKGRTPALAERTLASDGYRFVRRDSIGPANQVGRVFAQKPDAGTAADPGTVDTIFVGLPAPVVPDVPVVRVPMPQLRDMPYPTAMSTLTALSRANRLDLVITQRGINDRPVAALSAVVDSQQPNAGIMLSPQVQVALILRDPAAPPPQRVVMPNLKGRSYDDAAAEMTALSRLLNPPPVVLVRGVNGSRFVRVRSIVDSQFPSAGTVLAAGVSVQMIMLDSTTVVPPSPPPSPPQLPPAASAQTMPSLIGIGRSAAIDSITALNRRGALNLVFSERGANGNGFVSATALVDSQRPAPGALLSPRDSVQLIVRSPAPSVLPPGFPPVQPLPPARRDAPLWWWPVAALSLLTLAAAASTVHVKRARARVETMHIEPHADSGKPKFLTAGEAFARLGVSLESRVDPGTQRFRLTSVSVSRSE